MIKYCVSITIVLLLSSCATLLHQSTADINILSTESDLKVCLNNDSSRWMQIPAKITVQRSEKGINLTVKNDSTKASFYLQSNLSPAFWLGNLFSTGLVGYAIDMTNDKRYTYPKTLMVKSVNGSLLFTTKRTPENKPLKNSLSLSISIPEGNWLHINNGDRSFNQHGFLGLACGLEYYFCNQYYLSSNAGFLTDFRSPIPVPLIYVGPYSKSYASYIDFQLGSYYNKLYFGAGLQLNETWYYEREVIKISPQKVDILKYSNRQLNFGMAFSSSYRFSNRFSLGINYYPSFVTLHRKKFDLTYSHLLFFELGFRKHLFLK